MWAESPFEFAAPASDKLIRFHLILAHERVDVRVQVIFSSNHASVQKTRVTRRVFVNKGFRVWGLGLGFRGGSPTFVLIHIFTLSSEPHTCFEGEAIA